LGANAAARTVSCQELCSSATSPDLEPPAIANPLAEAELPRCNEQQLDYGFDRKPDPAAACNAVIFSAP